MDNFTQSDHPSLPWFRLVCVLLGSLLVLFVLAPLLGMLFACSFPQLSQAAADPEVTGSMGLTLAAALAATIACSVCGVPLAYLLARKRFFGRTLVLAIIDLPIIVPHSAAGIALLTVIGRKSPIGRLVDGGLVGTTAGIAVAMAFVSLPFLVNAAREAFAAVPQRLERVARTLGASPARAFMTVSLPLAWRGILTGMIMMWARGISEFGAVIIIAYHPLTTPVLVFDRFNNYSLAHARSAAVLLVALCVAIFAAVRLLTKTPSVLGGQSDA